MKLITSNLADKTKSSRYTDQMLKTHSCHSLVPYSQSIVKEVYVKHENFKYEENSDQGVGLIDDSYCYQI